MATLICAVLLSSRCPGHHAVPAGAVTFLVRLCRWRDVTRRTNVIGEILQRSNYRTYFWLQPVIYVPGNVVGPLMGATVSAMAGFRWVFIATAAIVLINIGQLTRRYVVGVTRKKRRPIAVHRNGASVTIWFKLKDIFFIREVFL